MRVANTRPFASYRPPKQPGNAVFLDKCAGFVQFGPKKYALLEPF